MRAFRHWKAKITGGAFCCTPLRSGSNINFDRQQRSWPCQTTSQLSESRVGRRRLLSAVTAGAVFATLTHRASSTAAGDHGQEGTFNNRKLWGDMNKNHAELIEQLQRDGRLRPPRALEAMRAIDRGFFVGSQRTPSFLTYQDSPLPIGYSETISAPHMHATCLELLEPVVREGAHVLDVGSGSGYLTAALAVMAGESGRVVGIEKHPELAMRSLQSIKAAAPELLTTGRVRVMPGNVLGQALEEEGPFDAIHVGAAAASMPQQLIDKLKPGGRMVIPVGTQDEYQALQCVDKDDNGNVSIEELMYVRYVPLTEPEPSDR